MTREPERQGRKTLQDWMKIEAASIERLTCRRQKPCCIQQSDPAPVCSCWQCLSYLRLPHQPSYCPHSCLFNFFFFPLPHKEKSHICINLAEQGWLFHRSAGYSTGQAPSTTLWKPQLFTAESHFKHCKATSWLLKVQSLVKLPWTLTATCLLGRSQGCHNFKKKHKHTQYGKCSELWHC